MARIPNLLMIWTDQQRGDALGVLNPRLSTPNLDRLAGCSTLFERAYCSQPVCTPARGSVMTGLWPHQHGTWLNNSILPQSVPCLPELLPRHWNTGHVGKWHLGLELFPQHGFDHWVATEDDYQKWFPPGYDRSIRSPYHHFLESHGYTADEAGWFSRFFAMQVPEAHGKPAFAADQAIAFLQRQERDQPWCLVVNTLEPHHPNTSPRNRQYDPAVMPLPPGLLQDPPVDTPLKVRRTSQHHAQRGIDGIRYPDERACRQAIANYYGLVSLVDTHYGRILDEIARRGEFDDTLIIFASDHGELLNQYRIWGKGVQYHGAIHVPLMIKLPGQTQARRHAGPVGQVDIVPTLLDAFGVTPPADLCGRSLLPACRGGSLPAVDAFTTWEESGAGPTLDPSVPAEARIAEARSWHQDLRTADEEKRRMQASVRTIISPDRWRYSQNTAGETELYDLNTDPGEARNLAHDPQARGRLADLDARLRAWQRRTGDFVALP